MPERVKSRQTEFDERHCAKLSGATDIQQANMSSDPNTTVNFGASQVSTQLYEHLQRAQTSLSTAIGQKDLSSMVTRSAGQVIKDLNNKIPRVNPTDTVKAKLKELADNEQKGDNEQKMKVEIDDDGFKIPQGIQHHLKKKLNWNLMNVS